jgi:hypothetical protein
MADGVIGADDGEVVSGSAGTAPSAGFFSDRNGVLLVLACIAGTGLLVALAVNFSPIAGLQLIKAPFLTSIDAWLWFAVASTLLWLPLLLLLLDPPDNMATGPQLALPLVTLGMLATLATVSVAFAPTLRAAFQIESGGTLLETLFSSAPLLAFFCFLSVILIARTWNAGLFARYAHTQYLGRHAATLAASAGDSEVKELIREVKAHKKEQGNAEALSALIATAGVALIIALASVAGGWNGETRIGRDIGLIIAAAIVGIFAVVFLLDWLAELPAVRALSRTINGGSHYFAWLAAFYNSVDLLLVRIGAHVAGASHNDPTARYSVLAGTQVCLAVMTWFLPDPLGLIPAFISFTLALSVSRLWAWVEEDRNLAMITQFNSNAPRRIGFKEDYRDEAIFGFMFVLAIIPMALKQADAGHLFNLTYFQNADHADPTPWFVYFCFELAKALPIIDWADIYLEPGNFDTLVPTDPWGQHATFVARAMVDLVLVAALLQAISITLRNRQQKALYAGRQISRLDELVEREELKKALSRPRSEWFTRGLDFRHYNPERLRELHSNTSDSNRKAFIELIFEQSGRAIGHALQVLENLARRRAPVADLQKTLSTVRIEHQNGVRRLHALDLEGIFDNLRGVEGLKTFKVDLLDLAEEVGAVEEQGAPTDLADLLELVIFSARRDQFQYTRLYAARILTRIVPRLLEADRVSGLLANLVAARSEIFGASKFVPEQLEVALVERLREIGPPQNNK